MRKVLGMAATGEDGRDPVCTGRRLDRRSISADRTVSDVLLVCPDCVHVFRRLGLNCCACANSEQDTVAAIARFLGVPVNELVRELNIAAGRRLSNTARLPVPNDTLPALEEV
jgi:hypothetical protein